MTKVYLNDQLVDLTEAEETKRQEEIEQDRLSKEQRILEKQNREDNKESGKQKLKDLGLDDDEINALMGFNK
jgi:hypothetical protein|tara:strand:+ start:1757 stop:1972 length:216 start_codon:yes stop_codon:yes gene_type:complete